MSTNAPKLFFSYSRQDTDFTRKLAEDLVEAGAVIWMDQFNLEAGQAWDNEIQEALSAHDFIVAILSPWSVKSSNVLDEIDFALRKQKPVIPVLYRECEIPLRLGRMHRADFTGDPRVGFQSLLKALRLEGQQAVDGLKETGVRLAPPHRADTDRLHAHDERAPSSGRMTSSLDQAATPQLAWQMQAEQQPKVFARENQPVWQSTQSAQWRSTLPRSSRSYKPDKKLVLAVCGVFVFFFLLYKILVPSVQSRTQPESAKQVTVSDKSNTDYVALPAGMDSRLSDLYHRARAGDPVAMSELGRDYAYENGVPKNYGEAVNWFRKAAAEGDVHAMRDLGIMYDRGWGVENRDPQQANSWYRKAADAGDAEAMFDIGLMYENGDGVEPNLQPAVEWYRKAADGGNAKAMTSLGRMFVNRYSTDYPQAISWFSKAAAAGDPGGMAGLGDMYLNGWGVDRSYPQALSWYRKAVGAGDSGGMVGLGYLYLNGYGVEKDYPQGISWYRKAAKSGNQFAVDELNRLGVSQQ